MTVTAERHWWDHEARIPEDVSGELWSPPLDECVDAIVTAIEPALLLPHAVLELGCGTGRLTAPIAAMTPNLVVAVDISQRMLAQCPRLTNVLWMLGDGETLPCRGPLAAAWSMLTFQHLPHEVTARYIAQIAERLVSGGVLRFQHVLGTDDTFLSHQLATADLATDWCEAAGLEVTSCYEDLIAPGWLWVTAVKP